MKKTIKLISVILSAVLIISAVPSLFCSAAIIEGPKVSLTLTDEGEDIFRVDVALIENPGVGAMTFTVTYDKDCFSTFKNPEYFYSVKGISSYLVVDHPETGYVSVVWADGGNTNLFTGTSTFLTLYFKLTNKVPGEHYFKISNINPIAHGDDLSGCFADFEHNTFYATALNDSYLIGGAGGTQKECTEHSWALKTKAEPSCTDGGYSVYKCSNCGNTEKRDEVSALGHDFESVWTVDRAAQNGVAMIISRHCKRCGAKTDEKYISDPEKKLPNVKNKVNEKVTAGDLGVKTPTKDDAKTDVKKEQTDNNKTDNTSEPSAKNDIKEKNNSSKKDEIVSEILDDYKFYDDDDDDDLIISADEIVEKMESDDVVYIGKVAVPKKIKTIGDFITKISVYLFGAGDTPGIITIILGSIIDLFV